MLDDWQRIIGQEFPRYWDKFWWGPKFMGFAVGNVADRFDASVAWGAGGVVGGTWQAWEPMFPLPEDPRQSTW